MTQTPEHRWGNTALAVLVSLPVFVLAISGLLFQSLTVVVVLTLLLAIVSRIRGALRKDLELGLLRRPLAPELRWYRIQLLVRVLFLSGWLVVASYTIPLLELFDASAKYVAWTVVAIVFLLSVALSAIPRKAIAISTNVAFAMAAIAIAGLWIQACVPATDPAVELDLPVAAEIAVVQGGGSLLLNHHHLFASQRHALDLVVVRDGRITKSESPKEPADYACFGQIVLAPHDGTVVRVKNDRPDMALWSTDVEEIAGNHIVLDIGEGRYLLLAHLQRDSAMVKEGDAVRSGTPLGRCGNSGNTTMPHLHIQVQSAADFEAKDAKTFPIALRAGDSARGPLRRGDRLRPAR